MSKFERYPSQRSQLNRTWIVTECVSTLQTFMTPSSTKLKSSPCNARIRSVKGHYDSNKILKRKWWGKGASASRMVSQGSYQPPCSTISWTRLTHARSGRSSSARTRKIYEIWSWERNRIIIKKSKRAALSTTYTKRTNSSQSKRNPKLQINKNWRL